MVDDLDPTARHVQDPRGLAVAQEPVHRRSRRADHLREVLLGERDHRGGAAFAEHRFELEQAAPHTPLDGYVQRVEELDRQPAHLGHERFDEQRLHRRLLVEELLELVAMDHECLRRVDGDGGRVARRGRDDRQLPEEVAGSEHADGRDVTERGGHTDRDVTLAHEMERLTRVAFVEDDLVAGEAPAPGGAQERAAILIGEHAEDRPVHARLPNERGVSWVRCTRSTDATFALDAVTGS